MRTTPLRVFEWFSFTQDEQQILEDIMLSKQTFDGRSPHDALTAAEGCLYNGSHLTFMGEMHA